MTGAARVAVLIESHYDEKELNTFNEFFPRNGVELDYVSFLWNQPLLTFKGNDFTSEVAVTRCVTSISPEEYEGIILIGGYAMDRLRYEEHPRENETNAAPAVEFLRRAVSAMDARRLVVGAICHSLWLFCADRRLLDGRSVTCAHNIMCDVENAGGRIVFEGGKLAELVIDGGLVTGQHPGMVDRFVGAYLEQLTRIARHRAEPASAS